MKDLNNCPLCRNSIKNTRPDITRTFFIECDTCGKFKLTEESIVYSSALPSYKDKLHILSAIIIRRSVEGQIIEIHSENIDEILNSIPVPQNPIEKMNLLIKHVAENTVAGEYVHFHGEKDRNIAFAKNSEEWSFLIKSLKDKKYIENPGSGKYRLTIEGWQYYESIPVEIKATTNTNDSQNNNESDFEKDVFISYASKDRSEVAQPIAEILTEKGYSVWFDGYELLLGDSLRRSIEDGLKKSRYGVTILSHNFFSKNWPQKELDGLFNLEHDTKKILPVWHNLKYKEVASYSPILADRLGISTSEGIEKIVQEIIKVLERK